MICQTKVSILIVSITLTLNKNSFKIFDLISSNFPVQTEAVGKYFKSYVFFLVVMAEDSWPRGRGFESPLRRPFFMHHSLGSKHGNLLLDKKSAVAGAVILQMGGGILSNCWQLLDLEWNESSSADWDQ